MCAYYYGIPPKEVSVSFTLTISDFSKFNPDTLKNTLASQSGIDPSQVEIVSIKYTVDIVYTFSSATMTNAQAKKSIANANSVSESLVTVTVSTSRRLQAVGRRLATTVAGQITTTDATVAEKASVSAANATSFAAAVTSVTGASVDVPTVAVKRNVVLVTKLKSATADAPAVVAPDLKAVASSIGTTMGITVEATDIKVASPETTAPTTAPTTPTTAPTFHPTMGGVSDFGCRSSSPTAMLSLLLSLFVVRRLI
jgi:hypothetical protein